MSNKFDPLKRSHQSLFDTNQRIEDFYFVKIKDILVRLFGRAVKAKDLKSFGASPRRFKSCSSRLFFLFFLSLKDCFSNFRGKKSKSSEEMERNLVETDCSIGKSYEYE
jgi:hypothetical protein